MSTTHTYLRATPILSRGGSEIERIILDCRSAIDAEESRSLQETIMARLSELGEFTLAYSGGVDSALLLHACVAAGAKPELFVLTTSDARRDRAAARSSAAYYGMKCEEVILDEAGALQIIEAHRELFRALPDYTQRILALCELKLAAHSSEKKMKLVAGHGPEALLGGFRRREAPTLDDTDAILATLRLNLTRLNAVATTSGCDIDLPYLDPRVFACLAGLARAGARKEALADFLPAAFPLDERKSSLQNGSGVHYLFERMAASRGFTRTRDCFEALLS